MKQTLKIFITMFIFAVAFIMTGIDSEAAKYVTLKEGKWATGSYNVANYYKIVAPSTGYCRIFVDAGLVVSSQEKSKTSFDILNGERTKRLATIYADSKNTDDIYHYLKKGQVLYVKTAGKSGDKHRVAFKMAEPNLIYKFGNTFNMQFTDETLKNGVYVGLKANKTGIMTFNTVSSDVFNIMLTNASKTPLSVEVSPIGKYYSAGKTYLDTVEFGVKQNQIYYMKLTDTYGGWGKNRIVFKAGIKAAYYPSVTMNTARALGYNKPVTTALYTKGYSWYKFYLSSPRKVSIYINTVIYRNSKDRYYTTIYKQGSSRPIYTDNKGEHGFTYTSIKNGNIYINSSVDELKPNYALSKGMYYIKIMTTSYTANGYTKVWYK